MKKTNYLRYLSIFWLTLSIAHAGKVDILNQFILQDISRGRVVMNSALTLDGRSKQVINEIAVKIISAHDNKEKLLASEIANSVITINLRPKDIVKETVHYTQNVSFRYNTLSQPWLMVKVVNKVNGMYDGNVKLLHQDIMNTYIDPINISPDLKENILKELKALDDELVVKKIRRVIPTRFTENLIQGLIAKTMDETGDYSFNPLFVKKDFSEGSQISEVITFNFDPEFMETSVRTFIMLLAKNLYKNPG